MSSLSPQRETRSVYDSTSSTSQSSSSNTSTLSGNTGDRDSISSPSTSESSSIEKRCQVFSDKNDCVKELIHQNPMLYTSPFCSLYANSHQSQQSSDGFMSPSEQSNSIKSVISPMTTPGKKSTTTTMDSPLTVLATLATTSPESSKDGDTMFPTKNYPETVPAYMAAGKNSGVALNKDTVRLRNEFICRYNFDDVVLTQDGKDIYSIGPLLYKSGQIRNQMLIAFLRKNNQTVGDMQNKKEKVVQTLVHIVKSRRNGSIRKEKIRESVVSKTGGSSNALTKPTFVTKTGTLFRAINVVTSEEGRPMFIRTRQNFGRNQLDNGTFPYFDIWNGLHKLYETADRYGRIGKANDCLVGVAIDDKAPSNDIDNLSVTQFKRTVEYVMAHYKRARNNKNKSGRHDHFAKFVHGKWWLLYLHNLLQQIGDSALSDCFYVMLPENVLLTSDNQGDESSIDDQSLADSCRKRKLMAENLRKKKNLIETKTKSLAAIESRNRTITYTTSTSRINILEKELYEHQRDRRKVKKDIKKLGKKLLEKDDSATGYSSSDEDSDKEEMVECKEKLKYLDRVIESTETQLNTLKKSIGSMNNNE